MVNNADIWEYCIKYFDEQGYEGDVGPGWSELLELITLG